MTFFGDVFGRAIATILHFTVF